MKFELIAKDDFAEMANAVGFRIIELYGNYDRSIFVEDSSPVMIWVLEKKSE